MEHVLGMLAAGDDAETILSGYPWLEPEDIRACMVVGEQIGYVEESADASEWRQDVEPDYDYPWLEPEDNRACMVVGEQIGYVEESADASEWRQDVEPDYDSEEDTRTAERSGGHWVVGHA